MSNNKQSSVELFAKVLYEKGYLKGNDDEINDLLEHHKAMYKQEIEKLEQEIKFLKTYIKMYGTK